MLHRAFLAALAAATVLAAQVAPIAPAAPAAPQPGEVQKPADPPRLKIEPAGRVDLGSLGPRQRRDQAYTFTNTSKAPIALRVFDLSPGVTADGPALEGPIAPGAGARLTVHVDPTDWVGPQTRNVRLGTDDPNQGSYYLPSRMVVRPDLTVDQERRSFGDVAVHESPEQVFTFTRETGEPTQVRVTSVLPPYLALETRQAKNQVQLVFTLRPGLVEPGVLLGFERIAVATNAPMQPSFDLYLDWKLHHAVGATPSRVVFLDPDQATQDLVLASRSGAPFRLLSAQVEGAGFQVEGVRREPAATQTLVVRRVAAAPARAMLVLRFEGEDGVQRIPLAYLPSTPPGKAGASLDPAKHD